MGRKRIAGGLFAAALSAWTLAASGGAQAEVLDASDAGFGLELVREVPLAPDRAWSVFVEDVGRYWSPAHTYSGDSANLSIDPRPGGCFCESFGSVGDAGPGVRHLEVGVAWPGRELRLLGGLGPLQAIGATGALTVAFEPRSERGSRVTLTYRVNGHVPEGMATWAAPVDGVLREQLERYAAHTEAIVAGAAVR